MKNTINKVLFITTALISGPLNCNPEAKAALESTNDNWVQVSYLVPQPILTEAIKTEDAATAQQNDDAFLLALFWRATACIECLDKAKKLHNFSVIQPALSILRTSRDTILAELKKLTVGSVKEIPGQRVKCLQSLGIRTKSATFLYKNYAGRLTTMELTMPLSEAYIKRLGIDEETEAEFARINAMVEFLHELDFVINSHNLSLINSPTTTTEAHQRRIVIPVFHI